MSLRDPKKSKIFDTNKKEKVIYVHMLKIRKILMFGTFRSINNNSVKKLNACSKCQRMMTQESPLKSMFRITKSLNKVSWRLYFWNWIKKRAVSYNLNEFHCK